jgi:5-formaminoimidazole-4-carboxamide-1-beta-D-ribofuranosyl 5'-monophosphate synthetase
MNRAERRRKAREYNTPNKLEGLERQLDRAIRKEYEENANRRMDEFIRGYTTLVIYVLWYSFGLGKKRIKRFSEELEKHLDILGDDKRYELTLQDMTKMLREEADVDLQFLDQGQKIDRK